MKPATLAAVVDRLIPPDDFPGANEAGVCDYLVRLFQTDMVEHSEFFQAGIESIDNEARLRFDAPFAELTPAEQFSTLKAIESGDVRSIWAISPSRFFEMLVNTTAEGFYTDSISWVMTGFEERAES